MAVDTIELASLPPIDGLRFRHYRGEDDLVGMTAANMATRRAFGIEETVSVESMRTQYANLTGSDLHDDLVVIELDGTVVGYGRVEIGEWGDIAGVVDTVGILDPALQGRGIGGALLDWMEARAVALVPRLAARPERWIQAYAWDRDARAARLLTRRGYLPARRSFEMARPHLDDLPDAPLPDGFEVRMVGREDLRRIWEADNDMFRDQPGEVDESETAFRRFSQDHRIDPALFVVAFAGDEIAGFVLNVVDEAENREHHRRWAILDSIGVRAEYRRRGLARALIARSLRLLRDRGLEGATLGVDAENPNQALTLYQSCGFEVRSSMTIWRRSIDDIKEPGA
jgi:mycothiol synthase